MNTFKQIPPLAGFFYLAFIIVAILSEVLGFFTKFILTMWLLVKGARKQTAYFVEMGG